MPKVDKKHWSDQIGSLVKRLRKQGFSNDSIQQMLREIADEMNE